MIFLHFFLLIERFFGFFVLLVESSFVYFSCFTANAVGGFFFLKELDIESLEYSRTNISGGRASVIPNEALPNIGRQPQRKAKDDRCNLPALL